MPETASVPPSPTFVFIYGTLWTGSGYREAARLAHRCLHSLGAAWIPARLYDLGRYPAAVPPLRTGERVHGHLCALRDPQICLPRLDAYEDCVPVQPELGLYRRERVVANLTRQGYRPSADELRWCWVYFFNGRLTGRPRIRHGDYRRWLTARAPRSAV